MDNYDRWANTRHDDEIDIIELLRRVWLCRRFVFATTSLFLIIGSLVAIITPEEFESSCDMVPQNTSTDIPTRFSSLAELAGINLGYAENINTLSPYVYEDIVGGTAFRKELMQTQIYSVRDGGYFSLKDYLIGEDAATDENDISHDTNYQIAAISHADYACMKEMERRIALNLDSQKGSLHLSVVMPEGVVAAQVAQAALSQLQRYITEFKIEAVQSNLEFVQQRYDEVKHNFENIQSHRARFRDANRNTARYMAQTELDKLDAEYALALNLYNELAMQLEQAKIKVKETLPVLTVINPVFVPFRRSKPCRLIIILIFVVVGGLLGATASLLIPKLDILTGYAALRRLLPEEAYEKEPCRERGDGAN